MKSYLFAFGWEDIEEAKVYKSLGCDFEAGCSTGIFIEAANKDQAISWGVKVAEKYLNYIYKGKNYSLEELDFSYWIEDEPKKSDWKHCLDFFQRIKTGVCPDFSKMTAEAYRDWCVEKGI